MGVILLGDKTAAARWLAYAKSRAAALAKQGNNLSQTFSPAEGVTIRVQTLQGNPRVWIEAGGDLVFTAGFENGDLHINMAADYDRAFRTRLTVPAEPGMGQGPHVQSITNLGEGMGFFFEGGSLQRGYVLTNRGALKAQVVVVTDDIQPTERSVAYIGKYSGQKRLISMFNEASDPTKPRVAIFATDSRIIGQGAFPLTFVGYPNVEVRQVYFLGQSTIIAIAKVSNGEDTVFYLVRSTDGGFSWDVNDPSLIDLVMDQYDPFEAQHWPTVRMTALPGGKVLAVGVGDPTFLGSFGPLTAFLSYDRGATFNAFGVITATEGNRSGFDPISIGGEGVVLNGLNDDGDALLFRSMDSGLTWETLPPIAPGVATRNTVGHVVLLKIGVLGMTVYADGKLRLYTSTDNGESWAAGQVIATAPLTTHFNAVQRIGNASRPLPANPAIPDLYENAA